MSDFEKMMIMMDDRWVMLEEDDVKKKMMLMDHRCVMLRRWLFSVDDDNIYYDDDYKYDDYNLDTF